MKKMYAFICRYEVRAAMVTLVASTLLIFASSIMRYIGKPINWSLEISLFLFAWCVFLSADAALRENRLVSLDLVTSKLPPRVRVAMLLLSYSIILVFLVTLSYYGFILSYQTRARAFQGIPNFSYTWVTLSMPIASLLMIITTILKIRALCGMLSVKRTG